MKTEDLYRLEEVVIAVLQESQMSRQDDFYLIACVLEKIRPYVTNKSMEYVLNHAKELNLPSFESITRARRKAQERYPELKDVKIADMRYEETAQYKQYAIWG